jgi:hypothetical protein
MGQSKEKEMSKLKWYEFSLWGRPYIAILAPSKCDASDSYRMMLGALWRDDWKSRYGVKLLSTHRQEKKDAD